MVNTILTLASLLTRVTQPVLWQVSVVYSTTIVTMRYALCLSAREHDKSAALV